MARNKGLKKFTSVLLMTVGLVALVGVGGLFVAGGFMNVLLLSYLPLVVHQLVGYVLIGSAILGAIGSFLK
jgi:hypothetical protein